MQNTKQVPGKITVLGAGAWGTAVAIALAARHDVLLWGRNESAMQDLAAARENRGYLPGFALPPALRITADFDAAVAHVTDAAGAGAPLLIAACPVAGLRPLLEQLKPYPIPNVVWLCKGFENGTGLLPHQVVREVLGDKVPGAALSGPSFAQEVAHGRPRATSCASAWSRWSTAAISGSIRATTWSASKWAARSRTCWRSRPAWPTASGWA